MARYRCIRVHLAAVVCCFLLTAMPSHGQAAGTGAISGIVSDPSGAVVPGADVTAQNLATGEMRHTASSAKGDYSFQLLSPGRYQVVIAKAGFSTATLTGVAVNVTETSTVNATLVVGTTKQTIEVQAAGQLLQTESSTLGQLVTGEMVEDLPLVTRNYTQIIDLSPGVSADVTNAGELGRGGGSSGEDPVVAAGSTFEDNNFQMDGEEINDLQGSGYFSGGVAVPNPDTIQEFKVQTSQYDASYGRDAGANVNIVTKTGTNRFHGTIWEFFRNEDLNANDYFLKQAGQPRPVLRQNQPGFALGGPVKKDKVFYFVSYQSTRQQNGVDPECSTSFYLPPLTNDRSAGALGALFAGQPTFTQELGLPSGATVAPDGSNISSQALALFNLKLPNGQYVIPTPQRIDASLPFASQGITTLSSPCTFNEDQFMTNGDWNQSVANQWQARFFFANSEESITFPSADLGGPTPPGFPQRVPNHYRNFSLINNHIFRPNLLNQAEFGYHRTWVDTLQEDAFSYSQIGATVPSFDNTLPEIEVLGGPTLGGNGQDVLLGENTFDYQDTVSWTKGDHAIRFGGGVTQAQVNLASFRFLGGLIFGTYSDLLLGQSAAQNGTPFSNIYGSIDVPGLLGREFRQVGANGWAQDDWKATKNLTLNLGFRYERVGGISDALGRTGNFDTALANPNPPASGSLAGFVVASNFPGTVPQGVTRSPSKLAIEGIGQNTLNPRFGFSWLMPSGGRMLLRGGYGLYHTTPSGQPNLQLLTNPPYGEFREYVGGTNAGADFATPIAPLTGTFPQFVAYSSGTSGTPGTSLGLTTFSQNFRPAVVQHFDLNTQVKIGSQAVFEVGYLGTLGEHLIADREPNQALPATPQNPIRGQTDINLANIPLRVPIEGLSTSAFGQIQSTGNSSYHALLANFTHRFHDGSQYQIAYTWSRYLADSVTASTGPNGGVLLGNQNEPESNYGPDLFDRPQRLIANFVYAIPTPFRGTSLAGETLGGWRLSGVVTVQQGHYLYVTSTNAFNAFGINGAEQDFAYRGSNCTNAQVATPGSVTHKLNDYFKASCFAAYPVIGDDGLATGFGNTKPGITRGPAQNNADLALMKEFPVSLHHDTGNVEFRAEAFNALNTPQFSDPVLYQDAPNFGVISTSAVSPRILQLAVKLSF
jgi:hypothetical protein